VSLVAVAARGKGVAALGEELFEILRQCAACSLARKHQVR
jgi:hypothetical protein